MFIARVIRDFFFFKSISRELNEFIGSLLLGFVSCASIEVSETIALRTG